MGAVGAGKRLGKALLQPHRTLRTAVTRLMVNSASSSLHTNTTWFIMFSVISFGLEPLA